MAKYRVIYLPSRRLTYRYRVDKQRRFLFFTWWSTISVTDTLDIARSDIAIDIFECQRDRIEKHIVYEHDTDTTVSFMQEGSTRTNVKSVSDGPKHAPPPVPIKRNS